MAKKMNMLKKLSGFTSIYQKKVKKYPGYPDLKNILGLLYYLQNKKRQALIQFEKALNINPTYEEALINSCFARHSLGETRKAIRSLTVFSKRKKKATHWTYLSLAIIYVQKNDISRALTFIRKACLKNPHDPYTLTVAGICQYMAGNRRASRDLFQKAQKVSLTASDKKKKNRLYKIPAD